MSKIEENLLYFYGIGPELAKKLRDKMVESGILDPEKKYSKSDIEKALNNPNIFQDLPIATQADLRNHPLRTIPRPLIEVIESEFKNLLSGVHFDFGGSFSRGKSTSGDIDMVLDTESIRTSDPDTIIKFLRTRINKSKILQIQEPYAKGSSKITTFISVDLQKSGIPEKHPEYSAEFFHGKSPVSVNIKIDIFLTTPENYIFAMLFAIGSGIFNVRMRATAKRKNYLLNQYGLFDLATKKRIEIKTEAEIFEKLGMKYILPKDRVAPVPKSKQ